MNRIFAIGHNDLRLFLKKKSAYVWLFVAPLLFTYFMSFVSRGPNDPANRRPSVRIENADTNFLGRVFMDELGREGLRVLKKSDREPAARTIRVPADFTASVLQQKQTKVGLLKNDTTEEADGAIIELRLVRALVALNGHLLETVMWTNAATELTEGRLRTVMARTNPVVLDARFAGRKPVPSGFNFSLPGNLVMYLMMNLLIFGGATVAAERREGLLRRFMVHPLSRTELVMGKIYGLMLLGTVQTLFMLAVGRLVFGVNLGANLPGVTLTLLVFTWVAGSLGVLAGSVVAAEDRVVGVCVLASLLMAALGGCWWPPEMASEGLKTVALCLPTGWALHALHQLISFGSDFVTVLAPVTVLLLFGAVANFLAIRWFRTG